MSGIKFVLDTNVVIGLLKGNNEVLNLAEQSALTLSQAGISQITRMELLSFPLLTAEEELAINDFLQNCQICLLDETIEIVAVQLRKSRKLKLPDAIVAATAMVNQATLLTLDKVIDQQLKRNTSNAP